MHPSAFITVPRDRRLPFLYACALLSGAAALIYELLWLRILDLFFGVGSFAIATTLAVFMLGLCAGSAAFGPVADRSRDRARLYVLLELGMAVTACAAYVLIQRLPAIHDLYIGAYRALGPGALHAARVLLACLILLPCTFCMGGTMPVLTRLAIADDEDMGKIFGRLYALNTLGAVLGASAAGFWLVAAIGVRASFGVAAALNLLVVAVVLNARFRHAAPASPAPDAEPGPGPVSELPIMLAFVFCTGLAAFGFEVVWTRVLTNFGLATTFSFTIILAAVLLGVASGSALVALGIDKTRARLTRFAILAWVLSGLCAMTMWFLSHLPEIDAWLVRRVSARTASVSSYYRTEQALAFILTYFPFIGFGALFPLAHRLYAGTDSRLGAKTGQIYFWNTLGSVVGSIAAAFVLIPLLGIRMSGTLLTTLLAVVALGATLAAWNRERGRRSRAALAVTALFALAASIALLVHTRPRFYKIGPFKEVIYYQEGLAATVTVIEEPGPADRRYRKLLIDSQMVSGNTPVLLADSKLLAHVPLLIARDPRTAIAVGYGCGGTSGSMLLHGVQVTAFEIEARVIEAGALFTDMNFEAPARPGFTLVVDDARHQLEAMNGKVDVIVTDVTNPKYRRSAQLYTVDYFRLLKSRINRGGAVAAWLPLGGLSFDDLRMVIASFHEAFPHTTVWTRDLTSTPFLVVIGTPERIAVDRSRVQRRLAPVRHDSAIAGLATVQDLKDMLLLGERDVAELSEGSPLNTDNRPLLEFTDLDAYFVTPPGENLERLQAFAREDLNAYFYP